MANINVATFFLVTLLLSSTISDAARREPGYPNGPLVKNQHKVVDAADQHAEVMVESCDGVAEEKCLMRKVLAAHTDYVYTKDDPSGWNPPVQPINDRTVAQSSPSNSSFQIRH